MTTTEHKPLPVSGYTAQSDGKIAIVNANKIVEEMVLRAIDSLAAADPAVIDQRSVAEARTCIQTGFMWLNRSVFQPTRLTLPGDKPSVAKSDNDKPDRN